MVMRMAMMFALPVLITMAGFSMLCAAATAFMLFAALHAVYTLDFKHTRQGLQTFKNLVEMIPVLHFQQKAGAHGFFAVARNVRLRF